MLHALHIMIHDFFGMREALLRRTGALKSSTMDVNELRMENAKMQMLELSGYEVAVRMLLIDRITSAVKLLALELMLVSRTVPAHK